MKNAVTMKTYAHTLYEKQPVMRSVGHCHYNDKIITVYERVNI
jgi:hypothetical protein